LFKIGWSKSTGEILFVIFENNLEKKKCLMVNAQVLLLPKVILTLAGGALLFYFISMPFFPVQESRRITFLIIAMPLLLLGLPHK
jgi:hypothetical protein